MRIAICLSGLVRTYRQTYDNFRDAILAVNPQHQFDLFLSTWPTEHSNNSMERTRRIAWSGDESQPFPEENIDYLDIQAKYRPTILVVEQPREFTVPWTAKDINVQSFLCMTYKIWHADTLRRHHELMNGWKYDLVIRTRFDTLMPFELPIPDDFDRNSLYIPSMAQIAQYPERGWCNDKFACGNSDIMTTYSNWFWQLNGLVANGTPVQPETLLKDHLTAYNIPTREWGCEMEMIRAF